MGGMERNRHNPNKKSNNTVKVAALGAAVLGLVGTPKGRDIVRDAWSPDKQPNKVVEYQNVGQAGGTMYRELGDRSEEPEMVRLKIKPGETVYQFAAENLKGDPRQYLEDLREQLPEDKQANYNAPTGFEFEVPASKVLGDGSIEGHSAEQD